MTGEGKREGASRNNDLLLFFWGSSSFGAPLHLRVRIDEIGPPEKKVNMTVGYIRRTMGQSASEMLSLFCLVRFSLAFLFYITFASNK